MFLKEARSGELVEVLFNSDLFDSFKDRIVGRYNAGEELPDPKHFNKSDLVFPSGEALPRCWMDSHYRDHELERTGT